MCLHLRMKILDALVYATVKSRLKHLQPLFCSLCCIKDTELVANWWQTGKLLGVKGVYIVACGYLRRFLPCDSSNLSIFWSSIVVFAKSLSGHIDLQALSVDILYLQTVKNSGVKMRKSR